MLGVLVRKCAVTGAALTAIASVGRRRRAGGRRPARSGHDGGRGRLVVPARRRGDPGRLRPAARRRRRDDRGPAGHRRLLRRPGADAARRGWTPARRPTTGAHAEVWTLSDPAVGTAGGQGDVRAQRLSGHRRRGLRRRRRAEPDHRPGAGRAAATRRPTSASLVLNNTQGDADFSVLALGNLGNLTQTPFLGPSTDTVTASSLLERDRRRHDLRRRRHAQRQHGPEQGAQRRHQLPLELRRRRAAPPVRLPAWPASTGPPRRSRRPPRPRPPPA